MNEKRGNQHQDCKKLYDAPADKGKQKAYDGKQTSGGGAPASVNCYRCGEQGHYSNECGNKVMRFYKCSNTGHHAHECKNDGATYLNYEEQGHISN